MSNLITGVNDLATVRPDLVEEWDYEKNENISPFEVAAGSSKKVWWLCKAYKHSWQAIISSRTRSSGSSCPVCAGHRVLEGFNDLATTHPNLIEEWDFEKNGDLKPTNVSRGSHTVAWWLCKMCGCSYQASIHQRTNYGNISGCKVCRHKRRTSLSEQAVFYYIKQHFPSAINSYKIQDTKELDIYIPELR